MVNDLTISDLAPIRWKYRVCSTVSEFREFWTLEDFRTLAYPTKCNKWYAHSMRLFTTRIPKEPKELTERDELTESKELTEPKKLKELKELTGLKEPKKLTES